METRHFEESMLMSSFDLKSIKKRKKRKPSSRLASLYLGVEKRKRPCCVFFRRAASTASSSTDGDGGGERKVMRLAVQLSTQESLLLVK